MHGKDHHENHSDQRHGGRSGQSAAVLYGQTRLSEEIRRSHGWASLDHPQAPDGTELVLEPDEHPAAKSFKEALVSDGIPFTAFAVDDVHAEFERLRALGVEFSQQPTDLGQVVVAVLDDTCGNLIQLVQQTG